MNTNNEIQSFLVSIDRAESIRRGIPAPTREIEIDIPLRAEWREWIAEHMVSAGREDPDLMELPLELPEPTDAGLEEAITAELAYLAEQAAEEAKRREKKAEARAALFAAGEDMDPSDWLEVSGSVKEWIYKDGIYCHPQDLSEEKQQAIQAASEQAKAKIAEQAERERQQRIGKLTPHMTENECEMLARGVLCLDAVEERLDQLALDSIQGKITPPEFKLESGSCLSKAAETLTDEEWRVLRRLETLTGLPFTFSAGGRYYSAAPTADGREINLSIREK